MCSTELLVHPRLVNVPYHDEQSLIADLYVDLERYIIDFFSFTGLDSLLAGIHDNFLCGDITVADRGISVAVRKALQSSRSTIRWVNHNDLRTLEYVLLIVKIDVATPRIACETIHCRRGTFN